MLSRFIMKLLMVSLHTSDYDILETSQKIRRIFHNRPELTLAGTSKGPVQAVGSCSEYSSHWFFWKTVNAEHSFIFRADCMTTAVSRILTTATTYYNPTPSYPP